MDNPIQMNDWEIRKFLRVIFSLQLAIWGVIGCGVEGLELPALRAFVGFVYLSYVPGVVVLRGLRIHGLGNIKTLLFAVGLSLSILMLDGLLLSVVYGAFAPSQVFTTGSVVLSTSCLVAVFAGIAYLRDRSYASPSPLNLSGLLSAPALTLYLLPLLVVLGVYMWDYYESNSLLMVSVAMIAFLAAITAWGRFIPPRLYPLAVAVVALGLLYHSWLLGPFIWGRDIHSEYYYADSVLRSSQWNPGLFSSTNAMLGIVILAPTYSLVTGLDLTWVFKIVYPTLFALIPLGLFWVFREQFDDRTSFLATFLFMTMGFYEVWLISAKQLTAELFLVLIFVLLMEDKMPSLRRTFLLVVFGFALIVTHYGTFYIFTIILLIAWAFLGFSGRAASRFRPGTKMHGRGTTVLDGPRVEQRGDRAPKVARASFIILLLVQSIAWYDYVARATAFSDVVRISKQVLSNTLSEFLSPSSAQGAQLLLAQVGSMFGLVLKYSIIATQVLIAIGVLALLIRRDGVEVRREYKAFAVASFVLLLLSIALPYFSSAIYTPRLYNIALVFLAPLYVVGGRLLVGIVRGRASPSPASAHRQSVVVLSTVLVVTVFLFGTGFAPEIAGGPPFSVPLSGLRMTQSSDVTQRARVYYDLNVFAQDVRGAEWLHDYTMHGSLVYNDSSAAVLQSYGHDVQDLNHRLLTNSTTTIPVGAYVYLHYSNVVGEVIYDLLPSGTYEASGLARISPLVANLDQIYSNGGDSVFYS